MTLWESKTFIRQSEQLTSAEEDRALKFYLGLQPEAGDLIPDTGGGTRRPCYSPIRRAAKMT